MKKAITIITCLIIIGHIVAYNMLQINGLDLFVSIFSYAGLWAILMTFEFGETDEISEPELDKDSAEYKEKVFMEKMESYA